MDFIKLNIRKIIVKFGFYIVVGSIINFFGYLAIRSSAENQEILHSHVILAMKVVFFVLLLFFSIYLVSALSNFYKARRMLINILHLKLFDNDEFSNSYLYRKIWLIYTKECVYGRINGYPTILSVDITTAKHSTITIDFTFIVTQLNKNSTKAISFDLEDTPYPNIKEKVFNFLSTLESKGYMRGSISNGQDAANMIGLTTA